MNPTTFRGLIYAIESPAFRSIKIGHTSENVNKRMAALQTGNPDELRIIGCWPGSQAHERSAHEVLAPHAVRGEWFYPTDPVLEYIDICNQASVVRANEIMKVKIGPSKEHLLWVSRRAERRAAFAKKLQNDICNMAEIVGLANHLAANHPGMIAEYCDQIAMRAEFAFENLLKR